MDTRSLGYLGLGALLAIILVTLAGVPPAVWIAISLIAIVVTLGATFIFRKAQADGADVAFRMVALEPTTVTDEPEASTAESPATTSPVEVELVRPAAKDIPAVWLHRHGGRRVHRFRTADGWTVQQVSTKDPDNTRKRVIGETLGFATEPEAVQAADSLAQGVRPASNETVHATPRALVAQAAA